MDNKVFTSLSNGFWKVYGKAKKNSPAILIVGGLVGFGITVVAACKETMKVPAILEEHQEKLDDIRAKASEDEGYAENQAHKDVTKTYISTGVKLTKNYLPAIGMGALSTASILGSHKIMSNRNVALSAAYTALDQGFKEYRDRAIEKYGEDADQELRYGVKKETLTETIEENGSKKKVRSEIEKIDGQPSIYARFFDESSPEWQKDATLNLIFLRGKMAALNRRLQTRGYLFLNEVYEELGFDPIREGQVLGWIWNKEQQDVVDFGIYDQETPVGKTGRRRFVNGDERTALLDFNVGLIIDKL